MPAHIDFIILLFKGVDAPLGVPYERVRGKPFEAYTEQNREQPHMHPTPFQDELTPGL